MQTDAAVLWGIGEDWKIERIDLDPPKHQEILVRMVASGLCHSDEHLVTGDFPMECPLIGGHEGAGVVEAIGPNVTTVALGDHVVTSCYPMCGVCPHCIEGRSNLCDMGALTQVGLQAFDNQSRHHVNGQDVRLFCLTGTFGHHTVGHEFSFVKIDKDIPLDRGCLLGCGVTTGWGSAVYRAGVCAGEDVAVVGVGGVGSSALQGARLAGAGRIFAVDPIAFKRDQAKKFGATHVAESIEEAFEIIQQETAGRMCHKAVATMSVGESKLLGSIMALVRKGGRAVWTDATPPSQTEATIWMGDLTSNEKELVGALLGGANPKRDIPKLAQLYRLGHLDLDGMITQRYGLSEINEGYQDMRDGKNIRGVVLYE